MNEKITKERVKGAVSTKLIDSRANTGKKQKAQPLEYWSKPSCDEVRCCKWESRHALNDYYITEEYFLTKK